ncbi:MAG: four helix bundle protein [Candidatus Uhrbacteria bacterium]|nr:four helix bundle protein [Candidatus Uhrbacteria bacterium]
MHTKQFPKMDRYVMGLKIFELLLEILVLVVRAQYARERQKVDALRLVIPPLDAVKVLVRLTRKLEIIDESAYIKFEEGFHEAGKMLGGWISDTENKLK